MKTLAEFNPELHPRDERGKFVDTGGTSPQRVDEVTAGGQKVFNDYGSVSRDFMWYGGSSRVALPDKAVSYVQDDYGPLTDEQIGAISEYQSQDMYREVNGALRRDEPLSAELADLRDQLDSVFEDDRIYLEEDVVVFRGAAIDTSEIKQGDVYQDKGYLSTSADPAVAVRFSSTVVAITVPKGYPAAYLPALGMSGEAELLLPRDTNIVIDEVKGSAVTARVILEEEGYNPEEDEEGG